MSARFCKTNNLDFFCRAHQMCMEVVAILPSDD